MTVEAAVALVSGLRAGSVPLTAFGADSVIEVLSAGVLLWRLNVQLARGEEFSRPAERTASRIGGALLFALGVYIVLAAAWGLWTRHVPEFSYPGLVITALAIPIMYLLARTKLAVRCENCAEAGSPKIGVPSEEACASENRGPILTADDTHLAPLEPGRLLGHASPHGRVASPARFLPPSLLGLGQPAAAGRH